MVDTNAALCTMNAIACTKYYERCTVYFPCGGYDSGRALRSTILASRQLHPQTWGRKEGEGDRIKTYLSGGTANLTPRLDRLHRASSESVRNKVCPVPSRPFRAEILQRIGATCTTRRSGAHSRGSTAAGPELLRQGSKSLRGGVERGLKRGQPASGRPPLCHPPRSPSFRNSPPIKRTTERPRTLGSHGGLPLGRLGRSPHRLRPAVTPQCGSFGSSRRHGH